MRSVLISGGSVVDPAGRFHGSHDVLVRDGLIAAVEQPGAFAGVEVKETFDASGLAVAPGFVDIHVHLREPGQTYKETIATGTAAAAAGGFTSVVAMPNTLPVNDSLETMRWMLAAERGPVVRVFAMPAATLGSRGETMSDFAALAAAGARGFTDDGKPILGNAMMRQCLVAAARLGLAVSQHAEDPALSNGAVMNAGPVAFRLGLRGYPAEAEARIVRRDIELVREIEQTDGLRPHLHVQHVSTRLALDAIRAAKAQGLHVTCEAAPHHFVLTDEALAGFDTNCRMNPPLRSEDDRQAVVAGLLDGTVDCIATDHAPHARHEKEVEFERAPNGITGLETAFGLAMRVLHAQHGMPIAGIVKLMSSTPAAIVTLPQAGSIAPGMWADLTLFEAESNWTFDLSQTRSKSRNMPFDGEPMLGWIRAVMVDGKMVPPR